jgi:hypothetical protein
MLAAGAYRVIWVQSTYADLQESLQFALCELSDADGIIIEGNGPLTHIIPDVVVFVYGDDDTHIKESAHAVLKRADFIIHNKRGLTVDSLSVKNIHDMQRTFTLSLYDGNGGLYDGSRIEIDRSVDAVIEAIDRHLEGGQAGCAK